MEKRTIQEIADFFGCYAAVSPQDESRVWLFAKKPFFKKDAGNYIGEVLGWVCNSGFGTGVALPTCPRKSKSLLAVMSFFGCDAVLSSGGITLQERGVPNKGFIGMANLEFEISALYTEYGCVELFCQED